MLKPIIKSLILVWAMSLAVFLALPAASQLAAALEDSPHVFRVESRDCTHEPTIRSQTGFTVAGLSGIVTALHGVADCRKFVAVSTAEDGDSYQNLTLAQVNIAKDLALLAPASGNWPSVKGFQAGNCGTVSAAQEVYVLGHPLGIYGQLPRSLDVGLQPTRTLQSLASPGSHAALGQRGSPRLDEFVLQVMGPLLPGDSGAPVLSADCVVGVVNGGLLSGTSGISWAMPWMGINWSAAVGEEFTRLQKQPVTNLFTFAGNEAVALANLVIRIGDGDPIPMQIPLERGAKTYDLRRFGVPPVKQATINVTIDDNDDKNVIAEGVINASNRYLTLRDTSTYQAIAIDMKRGFLLLSVKIADDLPTTPTTPGGITGFTFTIFVTNSCNNNDPIPNARVIGSVVSNTNDKDVIRAIDEPTGTKGEILLSGLPGEPEKLKITITSIKATNFQDLPSHFNIPNLGAAEQAETIPLTPTNNPCASTPKPSETGPSTPTPTPSFVPPTIYITPNRIAKAHLAAYCNTIVAALEAVNPGLPDPVEIDTIIVIPSSSGLCE